MDLVQQLRQEKIIAILRGIKKEPAFRSAQALVAGGIRFLEVTLNSSDALAILAKWREELPSEVQVGAGTVMSAQMVREAVAAGASYLITPHLDREVVIEAQKWEVEIWPGVMTPSEVAQALKWGVRAVKLFPISFYGPSYIPALKGPFSDLQAIAVGGVKQEDCQEYLRQGAIAVAFGSHLFHPQSIVEENWEAIEQRARKLVSLVQSIN